jgi:hypothetical protein
MNRGSLAWLKGLVVVGVVGAGALLPANSQTTDVQSMDGPTQGQSQGKVERVPNELLVKFTENISESRIQEINERLGVEVVLRMSGGRLLLVRFPYPDSFDEIRRAYEATPGVEYVEPNYIYKIDPQIGTDGPVGGTEDKPSDPSISVPDERKKNCNNP